jgi:hypothetical protein
MICFFFVLGKRKNMSFLPSLTSSGYLDTMEPTRSSSAIYSYSVAELDRWIDIIMIMIS